MLGSFMCTFVPLVFFTKFNVLSYFYFDIVEKGKKKRKTTTLLFEYSREVDSHGICCHKQVKSLRWSWPGVKFGFIPFARLGQEVCTLISFMENMGDLSFSHLVKLFCYLCSYKCGKWGCSIVSTGTQLL